MSYPVVCPECGAPRTENHHDRGDAAVRSPEREVIFSRVLNGTQWREKPLAIPRYRDDVVPND